MLAPILLLIFLVSTAFSSHFEYPVHIHELGDFVVERPILENPPENAVILPPVIFPASLRRPASLKIYSQPALSFASLEAVSTYLMEKTVPRMIQFKTLSPNRFNFSHEEIHFINLLKYYTDHFNSSILEGINEYERIVAFGAVFLRIFKVSYPGLFRVHLRKEEIVDLALIASGWFMDFDEENENNKDIFLLNCIKIYYPHSHASFRLSLLDLYNSNETVAFEAALQLNIKRIPNRNGFVLTDLKVKHSIYDFLRNREMFLKLLPGIRNINKTTGGERNDNHVLLAMIRHGYFYPEAMLRPELKDFRIHYNYRECFEDFYSEALYFAIRYRNAAAITFLLNLDNSYYEVEREEQDDDATIDSDASVATPDSYAHPDPVSVDTLNKLRSIFFDEQVLEVFPDVFNFGFCQWDIYDLISYFRESFPNLMLLWRHVMEQKRSGKRISGNKRKIDQE